MDVYHLCVLCVVR